MSYATNYHYTKQKIFFIVSTLALLTALILSILSHFDLCTSACVEGQKFRLFNYKFEIFGLFAFTTLLLFNILSIRYLYFFYLALAGLAIALGAELYFLYLQKFVIGSWCPICLGIASCVIVAFSSSFLNYYSIREKTHKEGWVMWNYIKHGCFVLSSLFVGFSIAYFGTTKINASEEAIGSLKDSIAFGNQNSPLEVYIFSDWLCPSCSRIEPTLHEVLPKIEKDAKIFFIDSFIHEESMNFTPYNLSFMIYNKSNYPDLRDALFKLTKITQSPSDTQINTAIQPSTLTKINYKDTATAVEMFKFLKRQFNISSTPNIVMINTETKKGKKLSGSEEINENKILEAIQVLQGKSQ